MFVGHKRDEQIWAAGFFDGEGTVGCYPKSIILGIGQQHPFVLQRFRRAVGGLGKIYGPYPKAKAPQYYYKVGAVEDVRKIVSMLWFKLSPVKRAQARKALAAYRQYRRN